MTALGPQFLYHGTTKGIEGQILPAKVHGGHSYWGDIGSTRGEPANEHAWAHPNEETAWDAALDRSNAHYHADYDEETNPHPIAPRARVYALHPNEKQTPGNDASMAGEIKAPHFDIAEQVDTIPGRQGTFPQVNWNKHVAPGWYLPGSEDANHPSNLSVQFGHHAGVQEDKERATSILVNEARKEDMDRMTGLSKMGIAYLREKPAMLPGMSDDPRKYMRPRR